jgi:hypothetical protein
MLKDPRKSSHMSSSPKSGTFAKFPFLPKELRLKIWNYALSPRVISFHRDRDRGRVVDIRAVKFVALTTPNSSLEIIPRVCAESFALFQKRYLEWEVWDVRKNVSTTRFDPNHDVIYFSHEFARNIDHVLLREFAAQFPTQVTEIKTLALPAVFSLKTISGNEALKCLQLFKALSELVIVMGYGRRQSPEEGILLPSISRSTALGQGSESGREVLVLPDGVQQALELLKRNHLPDWKVPKVSVAKFLDEVLSV